MSELAAQVLDRLTRARLPGLSLGGDFIYPGYNGFSIVNLPAALCTLLGVPPLGRASLDAALLDPLLAPRAGPYRRAILVLIDALAFSRLRRW